MSLSKRIQLQVNSLVQGGLLVALAILLAWLSTRYHYTADWTQSGRNTLSETSIETLKKFDETIEITAYATEQEVVRNAVRKFVARYQAVQPDISLRFIDPNTVPDDVRNMAISVNGELVLRYKQRSEHVRSASEQEFTNALQRLLRDTERWLAFIEGHGERDPLGKANHDLSLWAQQLNERGFRIQTLNLSDTPIIPDNTSVLVLAGPVVPVLQGETELILSYLNNGGNLLWLQDPGDLNGLGPIADFLDIEIPKGTIIDFAGQLIGINDPTIALVTSRLYGKHDALVELDLTTLFPKSTAIATRLSDRWQMQMLLSTGDHTWLETGELKGEVGLDEDSDLPGPLTIGLSLERQAGQDADDATLNKQQRIIVIGDGDFLSNTYVGNSGNMELGLRLLNWLSDDDELIDIVANTAVDTQFEMDSNMAGFLGIFFVLIFPLSLFFIGLRIWVKRRKL